MLKNLVVVGILIIGVWVGIVTGEVTVRTYATQSIVTKSTQATMPPPGKLSQTTQHLTMSTQATGTSYSSSTSTVDTLPRLTAQNCTDFDSIAGVFQSFHISTSSVTMDEGSDFVVTCSRARGVKPSCRENVTSLLKTSSIYIENIDEEVTLAETKQEYYMDDVEQKQFTVYLDFQTHHDKSLSCRSQYNNVNLTSNRYRLDVTEALFVSVTPANWASYLNDKFTLTCYIEVNRTLKHAPKFRWLRRSDVSDSPTAILHQNTEDVNIADYTNNETGQFYSVLTASHTKYWKGQYTCTTVSTHSLPPIASASLLIRAKDRSAITVVLVCVGVLIITVVLVVAIFIIRRRALQRKIKTNMMIMEIHTSQLSINYDVENDPVVNAYAMGEGDGRAGGSDGSLNSMLKKITEMYAHWQRDRSVLVLKQVLGEGNFGSVMLGIMPDVHITGLSSTVAVKTIKGVSIDKDAINEFEKEIKVMTTLRHDDIVSLLGICTETLPLYIIMEYMENGPLNTFLMKNLPSMCNPLYDQPLTTRDLLYMSVQPCRALVYLSSKKIVHRDISARNCLVGKDLTVKLADFGLSRGMDSEKGKDYYKKDGGMVPVKWMAPEALTFGKYTTANDVWAFGILMWEIFAFGAVPYQWLSNEQVMVYINKGGRLERPEMCSMEIWRYVLLCWSESIENRISISGLRTSLSAELDKFNKHAVYHRD